MGLWKQQPSRERPALGPRWVPDLPQVPSSAAGEFRLLFPLSWRRVRDTGLMLCRGLPTPSHSTGSPPSHRGMRGNLGCCSRDQAVSQRRPSGSSLPPGISGMVQADASKDAALVQIRIVGGGPRGIPSGGVSVGLTARCSWPRGCPGWGEPRRHRWSGRCRAGSGADRAGGGTARALLANTERACSANSSWVNTLRR